MSVPKKISLLAFGLLFIMPPLAPAAGFICGDANGDGSMNVGDVMNIVSYIFRGGPTPDPIYSADANGDCVCTVSDAVYLINTIFKSGPAPICPRCQDVTIVSGCNWMQGDKEALSYQDCFEYEYDGSGNLHITHTNAHFNCCPDRIMVQATVEDGVIIVIEQEDTSINGGCDCRCLFDIAFTVSDVPPGSYLIRVVGMYLWGEPPLEIYANLAEDPTGSVCLVRPW